MREKIKRVLDKINEFYEQEDILAERNSSFSLLVALPRIFWSVFCGLGVLLLFLSVFVTLVGYVWFSVS